MKTIFNQFMILCLVVSVLTSVDAIAQESRAGTNAAPEFDSYEWFHAGGRIASIPAGCTVGFTPQLVDFDGPVPQASTRLGTRVSLSFSAI